MQPALLTTHDLVANGNRMANTELWANKPSEPSADACSNASTYQCSNSCSNNIQMAHKCTEPSTIAHSNSATNCYSQRDVGSHSDTSSYSSANECSEPPSDATANPRCDRCVILCCALRRHPHQRPNQRCERHKIHISDHDLGDDQR